MSHGKFVLASGIGVLYSGFIQHYLDDEDVVASEFGIIVFNRNLRALSLIHVADRSFVERNIDILDISNVHTLHVSQECAFLLSAESLTSYVIRTGMLKQSLSLKVPVSHMSCGQEFALLLSTQSNCLFSMGSGNDGQLGLGSEITQSISEPTRIESFSCALSYLEVILQISSGATHSIFRTSTGRVFSFGSGSFCKLGHGDYENVFVPKLVEFSQFLKESGSETAYISCGTFHSALVTNAGDVYTWGWGKYGELGHCGSDSSSLLSSRRDQIEATPRLCQSIEMMSGPDVDLGICCGCRFTVVWSNQRAALSCKGLVFGRFMKPIASGGEDDSFLTFPVPTNIEDLIEFIECEGETSDRKRKMSSNITCIECASSCMWNLCLVVRK